MEPVRLVDLVIAIGTAAMPVVTIVGFVFIYFQIRDAERAIQTQARSQVYGLSLSLYELLISHPEFREYLYDGKALPTNGRARAKVFIACEMFCDFFEFILAEGKMLGADVHLAWANMMRRIVKTSPAVCAFVDERREQYTSAFLEIYDDCRETSREAKKRRRRRPRRRAAARKRRR
jgi:hypothetical protein